MSDQSDTRHAPRLGGASKASGDAPQLGGEAALKHIVEMMHSEDLEIRKQAVDRLEVIGSDRALEMLLAALDDPSRAVRSRAVTALGYLGDPRALDRLIALFDATEKFEGVQVYSGEGSAYAYGGPSVDRMDIIETAGRIGDSRGLVLMTKEVTERMGSTFHVPIRISWAIASIGAQTTDPEVRKQAARQFVDVFPTYEHANQYIINRLPWERRDLLDAIASLLEDAGLEVRERVACFLAYFDDPRGEKVLLDCLYEDGLLTEELAARKRDAVDGLICLGDRRVLDALIDALDAPFPHEYAILALESALEKWGPTLSPAESNRLTGCVPHIINYLKIRDINPHVVRGIRLIGTDLAARLVDEWLGEEIVRMFASFIERGDPSEVPDDIEHLGVISHSFYHEHDAGILTHPLMRRYAFPALRARHDWLRAHDPVDSDYGWVIASIGWLGDPRALPWLVQELAREEQEVLARREEADDDCHDDGQVGEYIYAIANLHVPEGAAILTKRLLDRDSLDWYETNKALRFYINDIPDERVVLAQLAVNTPDGYFDVEVIEAIGRTGLACAVPGLARLLARRDHCCAEAINSLAEIAKRNPGDADLVREIVENLVPMLRVRQRVGMDYYFQPLDTMAIDEFTALVLKDIGTPEALAAVAAWEKGEYS